MKRFFFVLLVLVVAFSGVAEARRHHHVIAAAPQPVSFWADGGGGLIREARRHLGGNPTGWARVWCGRFLDMVLRRTGHAKGSNLARRYAGYGHHAAGPCVGCIVVWRHHVGVVTAVSHNGITVISGNDGRRVRERERSMRGVIAYRWP